MTDAEFMSELTRLIARRTGVEPNAFSLAVMDNSNGGLLLYSGGPAVVVVGLASAMKEYSLAKLMPGPTYDLQTMPNINNRDLS